LIGVHIWSPVIIKGTGQALVAARAVYLDWTVGGKSEHDFAIRDYSDDNDQNQDWGATTSGALFKRGADGRRFQALLEFFAKQL